MEDEPLEEWAARRAQRRPTPGERRAVPLGEAPEHGTHVDPDAPRAIQEWDGHTWVPAGVAEDHQAATDETGADAESRAERVALPSFNKLPQAPERWRPTQPWQRP
ncbi:DUF6087 family protein [Streptomyces sp. NPDC052415]|uniref:DUF6087 family protein n=1 Tax=Streptomyces sp. NPDC052415 TaxID=3365690 RepID=UPI0037D07C42